MAKIVGIRERVHVPWYDTLMTAAESYLRRWGSIAVVGVGGRRHRRRRRAEARRLAKDEDYDREECAPRPPFRDPDPRGGERGAVTHQQARWVIAGKRTYGPGCSSGMSNEERRR